MGDAPITRLQNEITALESLLADKKQQLEAAQMADPKAIPSSSDNPAINNHSPPETKIALFRSLFKGRDDVYARRFESKKTGKSGYRPACRNEWIKRLNESTNFWVFQKKKSAASAGTRKNVPV
jgi:hypothetical protein